MYMSPSNFNPSNQLTKQDLPDRGDGLTRELAFERNRTQMAERHSALLAAVVAASEYLLKSQSLKEVIDEVLAQMGKALAVDRCAMGVYLAPDEHDAIGYVEFQHEWVSAGIARQLDNPALCRFSLSQYPELAKPLLAGIPIPIFTEEIADDQAREEQELTGAQSQFQYPIMVDGKLWGTFGVDDCRTPRVWSPTEIDSLRLVASAVASVVKREQLVEARIAAEREQVQAAKRQSELLAAVVAASELLLKSQSLADVAPAVIELMGVALRAD
jgi:GAF domain-containing protein